MRILILGVTGMLGHAIWSHLRDKLETFGSIRGGLKELRRSCLFFSRDDKSIIDEVNVLDDNDLKRALEIARPSVIVNCVGIVKQLPEGKYPIAAISLNALFPHKLARLCDDGNIRLIHMSTDCVFSGEKGNYVENDFPDADDLYGRTKYLGEVTGNRCLTLRASIVGRQLSGSKGLLEWFLSQKGKVRGYRKAVFSGLTTYAIAEIIGILIEKHSNVNGLLHVSTEAINKYDLLKKLDKTLKLGMDVIPDDFVVMNRSLDSTKFREMTHIRIPTWNEMIEDLAQRVPAYEEWRF
ncbi:MAG: SDR family oxidoreductase [Nitrospirae bacterium]|nr:SDR family oxidoreductase [Nitrospirota bacterium]